MISVAAGACLGAGGRGATASVCSPDNGRAAAAWATVSSAAERRGASVFCSLRRSKVIPAYSVTAAAANPAPQLTTFLRRMAARRGATCGTRPASAFTKSVTDENRSSACFANARSIAAREGVGHT